MTKWDSPQGMNDSTPENHLIFQIVYLISRLKKKKKQYGHLNSSRNTFDKIQHPFLT